MKPFESVICILTAMNAILAFALIGGQTSLPISAFQVSFSPSDAAEGRRFQEYVDRSVNHIVAFFGEPFKHGLTVQLCPSRRDFDKVLQDSWKMSTSERWMIGAADGNRAIFLSPARWQSEADDHNPKDFSATERIVFHELTHSFHGQHNPSPDFDQEDELAWLIEGLATYVSGQESADHHGQAYQVATTKDFPSRLTAVWQGKAKYGLAGSLVRYVDIHYGRKKLYSLLVAKSNSYTLTLLGTTEKQLIADWKAWLLQHES